MDKKRLIENSQIKEDIGKKLKAGKSIYGYAKVETALSREKSIWKNVITKIEILHKDDKRPKEEIYDYSNFCLARLVTEISDFVTLLDKVIEDGRLVIDDLPEVSIGGYFKKHSYLDYLPSNDTTFKLEWPCRGYNFIPSSESFKGIPRSKRLVSPNKPLFPDEHIAIRSFIGLDLSKYDQFCGCIIIFLPDYRAKIGEVRVGSKQLTLKIVCREILYENIIGKLYLERKVESKIKQSDLFFHDKKICIPLDFKPEHIHIALLDRKNEDIIDERKFHTRWLKSPSDVIFEISEEEIETLIESGENDTVEFKKEISRNTEELAETVVAFANTLGGVIFLGVNDNAEVTGFSDLKGEERVREILRRHCEPPINPVIEEKSLQDKPILLIRVKEGDNKPYTVRGKGPFVRCGSTDRQATRDELDEFFKKKVSDFYYR